VELLKKIVQFFIYSNVFVSFCVIALCQSTSIIIGVDSSHLLPFVFFSTLFAYNFQRILRFSSSKEQSAHLEWFNNNRPFIILITVISLSLSVHYAFNLSFSTFYFLIPASIISLSYPIKIIPLGSQKISLRELPIAKIFLIALVWSIVSVALVTLENDSFYSLDTILLFISRFSFILAITIPFDIRDLKYDDLSLKTIPQIFGEQKAKMIALYCLANFELISIFHFLIGDFSWQILLALMLTSLLSGILIIKSSQEKNNFFFSFWVEGASIIMYLLLFLIPLAFGILAL
tara:strand:- start:928 stop:1797 length:870 start_codon:yes stop_codon:yes gene_type:complete